jgi:hypothetical protein
MADFQLIAFRLLLNIKATKIKKIIPIIPLNILSKENP